MDEAKDAVHIAAEIAMAEADEVDTQDIKETRTPSETK